MKKLLSFLCLVFAWNTLQADPVWVPPKGSFHLAFSFTGSEWDQFLQTNSDPVSIPGDIAQYEFTFFGEYSLRDNLSLELIFPIISTQKKFVYIETDQGEIFGVTTGPSGEIRDVDNNMGLGDVVLGAKYIFLESPLSLGIHPYFKFPGTYQAGETVNSPGDGQTDLGLGFLVGGVIPRLRSYLRGSLTLVYRTGDPHNQMEFMIEPGVSITDWMSARIIYQHIEQFGGQDIEYYGAINNFSAMDEDSDRLGFGLSFRASDLLGIFTTFQQTLAGLNTANTKSVSFGVDFSF